MRNEAVMWVCGQVIFVGILGLAAWAYDRRYGFTGTGSTDLTIIFIITDAKSCDPIRGAKISVHSEEWRAALKEKEFELITDHDGIATRRRHVMYSEGAAWDSPDDGACKLHGGRFWCQRRTSSPVAMGVLGKEAARKSNGCAVMRS